MRISLSSPRSTITSAEGDGPPSTPRQLANFGCGTRWNSISGTSAETDEAVVSKPVATTAGTNQSFILSLLFCGIDQWFLYVGTGPCGGCCAMIQRPGADRGRHRARGRKEKSSGDSKGIPNNFQAASRLAP